MKSYIVERQLNANINYVKSVIKNSDIILSYIPYQVERSKNEITLRFVRYLVFSFKDTFMIEAKMDTKDMVIYTLHSERKNKFKIFISLKEDKGKSVINIEVNYDGEKEWIVSKFLHEIGESILNGIGKEVENIAVTVTSEDFSKNLGKLSFVTKLLMKSRLVKSNNITISKGQFISLISDIIQEFMRYQLIYVSGVSENESFRILFVGGSVKGVYVNMNGKESFDESSLNEIEGYFKINVYVSLEPEAILKGYINESA